MQTRDSRRNQCAGSATVFKSCFCIVLTGLLSCAVPPGSTAAGANARAVPAESQEQLPELLPNSDFSAGPRGWVRYSNFSLADEIPDWTLDFRSGQAVIESRECQPQARIGLHSEPAPLAAPAPDEPAPVYRLQVAWSGTRIHKSSILICLVARDGKLIRSGDIRGPGDEFDETRTVYFPADRETPEKSASESLLIYVFQDGGGVLRVNRVSLVRVPSSFIERNHSGKLPASPGAGPRLLLTDMSAAEKTTAPLSSASRHPKLVVTPQHETKASSFFPPMESPFLLRGEQRHFAVKPDTSAATLPASARPLSIESRDVAVCWEFGSAERIPFWLTPTGNARKPSVVSVCAQDAGLPALPPLPSSRSAYLFYWGHTRYGKKRSDEHADMAELRLIRELGFTGVCAQDDYGLDYALWLKSGALKGDFLTTFSRMYKETGFASPLVFGIYGGLDKGREAWTETDEVPMRKYLDRIKPAVSSAASVLAPAGIRIWPVDEPNAPQRRRLTRQLLPYWSETLRLPLLTTCNWQTAGVLSGLTGCWTGAGDYPSFEAAKSRGIQGFYCSIVPPANPLEYRWLAGVHAWASGLSSQAYWHFSAVSGSPESDLDGKGPDYLCLKPGSDPASTPSLSLSVIEISEGLQDLRLLCALESLPADSTVAGKAQSFLAEVRRSAPPTDRLPHAWRTPLQFEAFRSRAARLWAESRQSSQSLAMLYGSASTRKPTTDSR